MKLLPSALQAPAAQTWLGLTLRHSPFPLHSPSLPHCDFAVSSLQASWGSWPLPTGAHLPSACPVRAFEQALQPSQALSQQTPSTHWAPSQSLSALQAEPFGRTPEPPGPRPAPGATTVPSPARAPLPPDALEVPPLLAVPVPACPLGPASGDSVQAEIAPLTSAKANNPPSAYRAPIGNICRRLILGPRAVKRSRVVVARSGGEDSWCPAPAGCRAYWLEVTGPGWAAGCLGARRGLEVQLAVLSGP